MNANWVAGPDGDDGRFELMIVTSDDRRHVAAPSPEAMTALVALAQAVCVCGLIYGAYLCVRYSVGEAGNPPAHAEPHTKEWPRDPLPLSKPAPDARSSGERHVGV